MAVGKALDENNDIFTEQGRFAVVSEGAETIQHIRTKLRFFQGEWFLDVFAGVPYFQELLRKPVDLANVEAIIKAEILSTPDVEAITRFETSFEGETRKLTINFDAVTTYGIIEGVTING